MAYRQSSENGARELLRSILSDRVEPVLPDRNSANCRKGRNLSYPHDRPDTSAGFRNAPPRDDHTVAAGHSCVRARPGYRRILVDPERRECLLANREYLSRHQRPPSVFLILNGSSGCDAADDPARSIALIRRYSSACRRLERLSKLSRGSPPCFPGPAFLRVPRSTTLHQGPETFFLSCASPGNTVSLKVPAGKRAEIYFSNASATTSAGSVGVPTVKAMYCLPFTV